MRLCCLVAAPLVVASLAPSAAGQFDVDVDFRSLSVIGPGVGRFEDLRQDEAAGDFDASVVGTFTDGGATLTAASSATTFLNIDGGTISGGGTIRHDLAMERTAAGPDLASSQWNLVFNFFTDVPIRYRFEQQWDGILESDFGVFLSTAFGSFSGITDEGENAGAGVFDDGVVEGVLPPGG